MKYKLICTVVILILAFLIGNSFIVEDPYFKITSKDVELKIPKGFSKTKLRFQKK